MSNFSAVLVGINKYKKSPLRGCCNDVLIMRDILVKKYKVPASSIRLILDERATKNNIEERLEWLASNDSENKFFHYSGHGAQIPIQNYSVENYEVDGMNELLCPVDFNWNGSYILDNEIDRILSVMKKDHHMTMVIDSCHSGTIDRGSALMGVGIDMKQNLSKTIPTPMDLMSRANGVELSTEALGISLEEAFELEVGYKQKEKIVTKSKAFSANNVSILTGCREDQTSADAYFSSRFQGALSYFMQGILLRDPHTSLRELREKCALRLNNNRFTQVPQLLASKENTHRPLIQV